MTLEQAKFKFAVLNDACNEQVEFNLIAGSHPEKVATIDMDSCFEEMEKLYDQFGEWN